MLYLQSKPTDIDLPPRAFLYSHWLLDDFNILIKKRRGKEVRDLPKRTELILEARVAPCLIIFILSSTTTFFLLFLFSLSFRTFYSRDHRPLLSPVPTYKSLDIVIEAGSYLSVFIPPSFPVIEHKIFIGLSIIKATFFRLL